MANLDDLDEEEQQSSARLQSLESSPNVPIGISVPVSSSPSLPGPQSSLGNNINTMTDEELSRIDHRRKKLMSKQEQPMVRCDGLSIKRHVSMLKILVALLVAVIYFSVSYYMDFGNLEQSLLSSPSEVNYAGLRRTEFRLTNFLLIQLLTQNYTIGTSALSRYSRFAPPIATSSPEKMPFELPVTSDEEVLSEINRFSYLQKMLMTGNSDLMVDSPGTVIGQQDLNFGTVRLCESFCTIV